MNNIIKNIKIRKEKKIYGTPFCKVTLPLSVCVDPVTQDVVVLNRRAIRSGNTLVFSAKGEFKYKTTTGREKCDISGVAFTENLVYFTVRGDGMVEEVLICTRDGDTVTKFYIGVMGPLNFTGISVDEEGNIYVCEVMRNLIMMQPQDTDDGIHMIGEGILVAPKQVKAIRNEIIVLDSYQNRMSLILFNSFKECIKKIDFKIALYYRGFDVDCSGNFVLCTTERVEKWDWNGKVGTIAIKNRKKRGDISSVAIDRNRRVFYTHRRTEDKSDGIFVSRLT